MEKSLKEEIESLESMRLETVETNRKRNRFNIPLTILVVACGILMLFFPHLIPFELLGFLAMASIGTLGFLFYKNSSATTVFQNKFRSVVFEQVLSKLDSGMTYENFKYIPQDVFMQSFLYKTPNRYEGSGLTTKNYDGFSVRFSSLNAFYQVASNRNSGKNTDPIFNGIFFVITTTMHFQGHTLVTSDKTAGLLGFVNKMIENRLFGEYEKITLENEAFENYFQLFSSNPEQSKKLINPEMQTFLMDLRLNLKSDMQFSFIDNTIYMGLANQKNYFNPALTVSVHDMYGLKSYLNNFQKLLKIAEDLKIMTDKTYH